MERTLRDKLAERAEEMAQEADRRAALAIQNLGKPAGAVYAIEALRLELRTFRVENLVHNLGASK